MRIVPVYVWDKMPIADKKDRLVSGSEEPVLRKVIEQRGIKLRRPQEKAFLPPGENRIRFSRSHYRRNLWVWKGHVSEVSKKEA